MKKAKATQRQWRITLIRHKGERLGTVEAPDAETATKSPSRNSGSQIGSGNAGW